MTTNKSIENKEISANEIVGYVKVIRNRVFEYSQEEHIDFLGCSEPYVTEKIEALIFALKELKRNCKAVDKRQSKKLP